MGYSEKLEQSMKNFDREVDKLSKINNLVKEIDGLTELFLEESKDFQDSVKRLTELKAGIEKDCAVLSKFAGAEAVARQKLLTDVHEKITEDAQKIIDDLSEPLTSVKSTLNETTQKLNALATAHEKSQEKFLADEAVARQKLLTDVHEKITEDAQKIIDDLSEPLTSVKSALNETTQKLNALAAAHEKSQEKFWADEVVARQKLLADVHEKIITDSRQIINEIAEPLNATNAELQKTCKEIEDFIALHKKSQEKFLSDTENLLIKYNTKNLETYNNLLASLSNKIALATGTLEKLLANLDNRLAELSRKTDQNKLELENSLTTKLEEQNKKLSAEVETLKEKISVLSYIKTATTAAVGFGILNCIIHFIK